MGYKFFTLLSVILIIAQLALVLSSWIVVSIIPSLALKSLLSGEGIRWFLGSFADNIANPSLAWLVLCAMAYGVCVRSGLCKALFALMGGGAFDTPSASCVVLVFRCFCHIGIGNVFACLYSSFHASWCDWRFLSKSFVQVGCSLVGIFCLVHIVYIWYFLWCVQWSWGHIQGTVLWCSCVVSLVSRICVVHSVVQFRLLCVFFSFCVIVLLLLKAVRSGICRVSQPCAWLVQGP